MAEDDDANHLDKIIAARQRAVTGPTRISGGASVVPVRNSVIQEIANARARQIDSGNDRVTSENKFTSGEMSLAAAAYLAYSGGAKGTAELLWPWGARSFLPADARENLITAATLIIAEIERLDRVRNGR